ncbi:MAG: hypothetical protein ACI88H_003949 [Cocleimonas sp.]
MEIMGIYDDTLLDVNPAGDFHFGRHIHSHLMQREDVALSALHSTNIEADIAHAKKAELTISGTLEFGRDVTLPNGDQDRTKTTLALLPDYDDSRLSFFLCQQHRPELIYVPEWLDHPNTVYGYAGITIVSESSQHNHLRKKLGGVYGDVTELNSGFSIETSNGKIRVLSSTIIENELGKLPEPLKQDNASAIIAMDFYCQNLKSLEKHIITSGMDYTKSINHPYNDLQIDLRESILLTDSTNTGNTFFRFIEKPQ